MNASIKSLARPASTALLLAAMLSLAGCVADDFTTGSIDQTPAAYGSERYPIKVVKGPQIIEIDSHKGHLTNEQANAIAGFVHQAKTAGVTPMLVSRPAANGGPAFEVTGEVAEIMEQQGVPHDRIHFETYPGKANGPVKISFISTYAATKPCGDWNSDILDTNSNQSYPNLGCAVQSNIAAEISNPETLVVPNTPPLKQAGSAVGAVQREESAVNTVTLPSNYDYTN